LPHIPPSKPRLFLIHAVVNHCPKPTFIQPHGSQREIRSPFCQTMLVYQLTKWFPATIVRWLNNEAGLAF
jgi:hypothetical protein